MRKSAADKFTKTFLLQEFFDKRKSQKQIALESGYHVGTVETYMRLHKLTNQLTSRYKVRIDLMTEDNPYFIYTVGLFLTDGSISKERRLAIRINDKEPIKLLSTYFDCPIYHCGRENSSPQYEFNVPYVTPLTVYCENLIISASTKTFNVRCPVDIKDEKLRLLLLRGIIDGDGAIRKDCTDIRVFTASENMRNTLSVLLNSLDIRHTIINTIYGRYKKNGWTITVLKEATISTLIRVYQEYPELAIQRKRNIVTNKVYDIVRTYGMINHKKW